MLAFKTLILNMVLIFEEINLANTEQTHSSFEANSISEAVKYAQIEAELENEFWQESADGRIHSFPIRVIFPFALAIFCGLLGVHYLVCIAWVTILNLVQTIDRMHAKKLRSDSQNPKLRQQFIFSVLVSCTIYASIVPAGWATGNFALMMIMVIFTSGALIANGLRSHKIPQIGLAVVSPYALSTIAVLICEIFFVHSFALTESIALIGLTVLGSYYVLTSLNYSIANTKALKHSLICNRLSEINAISANEVKSAFLATMSHEMRTPLNAILGSATLLKRASKSEAEIELLQTLEGAGQNLLEILNDLLDLSKIEAGKMEFEAIPFSPMELVSTIKDLWVNPAQAKGLNLIVKTVGSPDAAILGDPNRIRQIVNNLVSNALKFTQNGSIIISIETNTDSVSFVVSDTGIGISDEAKGLIFTPYEQGSTNVARKFGGTGLGLSTSYKLAKLMGGELFLDSMLGAGSNFTFRINRKVADPANLPKVIENSILGNAKQYDNLRVLIADDNYSNRLILARFLEVVGIGSIMAQNGKEALELASANQFDLIFLDVRMPILDGLSACRAIRNLGGQNAKLPIIIVSADAAKSQIDLGYEAGASAYLTKPINPQKLFSAIENARNNADFETENSEIGAITG